MSTATAAGIAQTCSLPSVDFNGAWDSIKIDPAAKDRLLAQALMTINVRQKIAFEIAPLHGLLLLEGPPGTGKTTLARGLASQIAKFFPNGKTTFVQIDPHALAGAALGKSQQAVTRLFDQTLPEMAVSGMAIVLFDEIETLAASRQKMSLEANPVDVHRATDAVLTGLDMLAQKHKNILMIATTNFLQALDPAVISRADYVEHVGLPGIDGCREIVSDTLLGLSKQWNGIGGLHAAKLDEISADAVGLDGRRIRKGILAGIGQSVSVAKNPNELTADHIRAAFKAIKSAQTGSVK